MRTNKSYCYEQVAKRIANVRLTIATTICDKEKIKIGGKV